MSRDGSMKTEVAVGPRVLLRRMREIMAGSLEPQLRLDRIVAEIARNMVAEVCSLYVLRADGILELYATEGLNPSSVHHAQLRVGQGLVGTIAATARTLNLREAQKHPAFRYLPETGEEIYSSFLGVPVLRAGRTLGVLTVQNQNARSYREDEIEALQTVSMVLAEMMAGRELADLSRAGIELDLNRPVSLRGSPLSDGIGLGYVVLREPRIVVTNLFAEDVDAEIDRLKTSLGSLRVSIDDMLSRGEVAFEGEHRAVLEAYRMFAHDRGWVQRLEEAIRNGVTAEAAVEKVQNDTRARMMHITDPYLRERMHDFDDLANRLLRQLVGGTGEELLDQLGERDAIVVARSMGAAELLDYPRNRLRGLVLEDGALTSHVAIVARAMGIPVVGQARGIAAMSENGDPIIVDGDAGRVHLRPQQNIEDIYAEKVRFRAKRQEHYRELRDVPTVSTDGVRLELQMNAGLAADIPQLHESGAEGVGLFRTELQFMVAATFPRVERQAKLYRTIVEEANGRPVTFRMLDIGGDKVLPYLSELPREENPAMGWRAIRLILDRPVLFRLQIRALLRANGGRTLRLLLPMITQSTEIDAARELIEREKRHLSRFEHDLPDRIELGAMIEVPSMLYEIDRLKGRVDFISVGSNDLFQFLMAADRGNAQIAERFDVLSCPFLRALRRLRIDAEANGLGLSLCGEMASRPITALALLALGYRTLSMSPAAIGPVKAMILDTPIGALTEEVEDALERHSHVDIRAILTDFAERHDLVLNP